jgi:mono/diheme cytochrome c family protein
MEKNTLLAALVLLLLTVFSGLHDASAEGNGRKGKYLFRKNCRACHVDGGSAKELSPIDKTQEKWKAVFSENAYKNLACKDEWAKLSAGDLEDIFTYMHDHAFDSPSPAKCK